MLVYLLATVLSCWLAWQGEKRSCAWPWRIAAALPLTLVAALRWDVGTDFYHTYFPAFRAMECFFRGGGEVTQGELFGPLIGRLHTGSLNTAAQLYAKYWKVFIGQEWGSEFLMLASFGTGLGFRGFIALTAVLTSALVFAAIYRQSASPALAIYLYVATSNYFLGLNVIRQFVAIGFALVAVEFIVKRRPRAFLACILAGMFFHLTVIVVLPCYWVARWRIAPVWCIAIIGSAMAVSAVIRPILLSVMPLVGLGPYCVYLREGSRWLVHGFEWMFFALNLAVLAFGGCYWKWLSRQNPWFLVWYNMTVLGTVALALSGAVPLMKRINYYFAAPHFLLLPAILSAETNLIRRRLLTGAIVCAFALETGIAVFHLNKNEPLPYGVTCHPQHFNPHSHPVK